jgi:hypothetical protein
MRCCWRVRTGRVNMNLSDRRIVCARIPAQLLLLLQAARPADRSRRARGRARGLRTDHPMMSKRSARRACRSRRARPHGGFRRSTGPDAPDRDDRLRGGGAVPRGSARPRREPASARAAASSRCSPLPPELRARASVSSSGPPRCRRVVPASCLSRTSGAPKRSERPASPSLRRQGAIRRTSNRLACAESRICTSSRRWTTRSARIGLAVACRVGRGTVRASGGLDLASYWAGPLPPTSMMCRVAVDVRPTRPSRHLRDAGSRG